MAYILKKLIFISLIILLTSCTLTNFEQYKINDSYSIEVYTPNDKYNSYFKESLKRYFYINSNKTKYILKTKIAFNSTQTLSVSGQNVLKSTKAIIYYTLLDKNKLLVKSGSFNTFPALSSSSNSLYTKEKSLEHIKERLTKSSAKSLYSHINLIIRRLN